MNSLSRYVYIYTYIHTYPFVCMCMNICMYSLRCLSYYVVLAKVF